MNGINADMHCHSRFSDGWLEPAELVRRASANGVTMLALTDHDTLDGLDDAAVTAAEEQIELVRGVEISVTFAGETVHIVGLNVDDRNATLRKGLAHLREGRNERAERIGEALAAVSIPDALAGARRFARNPEMIGRAHFARHLVASGVMPDVSTVFRHYLARGKPGYVPHEWARLEDAVSWIRGAGGISVIAHPARYRFSEREMTSLFDQFVACGGEAVEVVSGAHSADEVRKFATIARRRNLLASRASDFHGVDESPVDLGGCMPLPPDLEPVWSRFS